MLRTQLAIILGKSLFFLTRFLKQGGGTAAPGYYALKIQPNLLPHFINQISIGSIVVTGTNGKTTTSRLISHFFSQNKISFIHNRQGSNLERGLISASVQNADWSGKIRNKQYALWELDEAVFPKIINTINPKHMILLNLFRDQLDRYGEVDATRNKWYEALKKLDAVEIIYNNDDPQIFYLVEQLKQQDSDRKYISFSVKDNAPQEVQENAELLSPIELVICPRCKSRLQLTLQTVSGQGMFNCKNCQLQNNNATITTQVKSIDTESVIFQLNNSHEMNTKLSGIYNLYNIAAASAVLKSLGYSENTFAQSLTDFVPAFGRMEQIKVNGKQLLLCLIKNPTGFSETLKTLNVQNLLSNEVGLILNDRFADGKDVSWIWDVPLHKYLNSKNVRIYVAGDRAYDFALRCKYAGISPNKIIICENISEMIKKIDGQSKTIPICATYTATLELQKIFGKTGVKNEYWSE